MKSRNSEAGRGKAHITWRQRMHLQSRRICRLNEELRKSGIDIIGNIPWGTQVCQFYQIQDDLIDTLVPYFKNRLENNEVCIWITSQLLEVDEAQETLQD